MLLPLYSFIYCLHVKPYVYRYICIYILLSIYIYIYHIICTDIYIYIYIYCPEDEREGQLVPLFLFFFQRSLLKQRGSKKKPSENAMVFDNFWFVYIGPMRNIAKHDFTEPPCDTQNIDVLHTGSRET